MLSRIRKSIFAYALSNNTYGVYYQKKRLWKQRDREKLTSLIVVDFDLDGQMELVAGFASGRIEIKKHKKGEAVEGPQSMSTSISKLMYYDFRQDGSK